MFFSICRMMSCDRLFIATVFFFQAEDGIRDLLRSRGLGDVYKRQGQADGSSADAGEPGQEARHTLAAPVPERLEASIALSLIHI